MENLHNQNSGWHHGSSGAGHEWKTSIMPFKAGTVEEKCTHKYWRFVRRLTELGISPDNWLLERSSVLSFVSLPISGIRHLCCCSAAGCKQKEEERKVRPKRVKAAYAVVGL
jgi:hypothetical protein